MHEVLHDDMNFQGTGGDLDRAEEHLRTAVEKYMQDKGGLNDEAFAKIGDANEAGGGAEGGAEGDESPEEKAKPKQAQAQDVKANPNVANSESIDPAEVKDWKGLKRLGYDLIKNDEMSQQLKDYLNTQNGGAVDKIGIRNFIQKELGVDINKAGGGGMRSRFFIDKLQMMVRADMMNDMGLSSAHIVQGTYVVPDELKGEYQQVLSQAGGFPNSEVTDWLKQNAKTLTGADASELSRPDPMAGMSPEERAAHDKKHGIDDW